ncbi:MAG: hypothetical protein QXD80_04950 [Acidilobaceae archaeon]
MEIDIITVIILALIDSIEPCIFALYTGILASIASNNISSIARVSIPFISSVFLGYSIFGFFLRSLISSLSFNKSILVGLLIVYGSIVLAYSILSIVKRSDSSGYACRRDDLPCMLAYKLHLYEFPIYNVIFVSLLGFIASLTLLPCTSGMYIVYNALMYEASISKWILLTTIYNIVFISPLILITLIFIGVTLIPNMYMLIVHRREYFRALGGLISIIIAIYILKFY